MASPSASSSGRPLNVSMYPNDGTVSKPIVVAISDRSLAALTKAGGLGGGSSDADKKDKAEDKNNTKGMLKHLAGIGIVAGILRKMEANSQVLNAYQSAMGKVFGAAMDMLLMPFLPLFNLIMIMMNKLLIWLISSGVLVKIQKVMEQVAKNIESIAKFFYGLFKHIIKGEWKEAARMIVDGIKDAIGGIFGSKTKLAAAALTPSLALATGGFMLGGPMMAMKGAMLPLTLGAKLLGLGGRGVGRMLGMGGGVGTPPIVPPAGGGGGVGAGGIGMGTMMKAGGYALAGQVASMGVEYVAGKMGYGKDNRGVRTLSYAAKGAGLGAAVGTIVPVLGTGVGAAVGGIAGGLYGYFTGGKKGQQQGEGQQQASMATGGSVTNSNNTNSYNTINVNVSIVSSNPSAAVNEAISAAEKKSGYQLKGGMGSLGGMPLPSKNTLSWRNAALLAAGIGVPGVGVPLAAKAVGLI